jgi:hypothetical protein
VGVVKVGRLGWGPIGQTTAGHEWRLFGEHRSYYGRQHRVQKKVGQGNRHALN